MSELTVSGDEDGDVPDDERSDGACSAGNCDEADGDDLNDSDKTFPQVRAVTLEGSLAVAVPAGSLSCISLRSALSSVLLLRQQFCAIQGSAQALQVP